MNDAELDRLRRLDERIREIVQENGLSVADVIFEIVSSQRVLEGMSYMFPSNFSHWTFGRDYERHRTIYEHTGGGIPYEQVWNFDAPKAFLVETNPFVLNVLILAHVYAHVDFFLNNRYLQSSRSFSDIALEARAAADRFRHYEESYGKQEVEQIIDAGMSIQWHQSPDVFKEEPSNDEAREYLLAYENAKLRSFKAKAFDAEFKTVEKRQEEIKEAKKRIKHLTVANPPEPLYGILKYIIRHSPMPLEPWMKDILTVINNQARCLMPNIMTKMLNEGWATYWHTRVMRQLFEEGLLTQAEHGVFNFFHSKVTREHKVGFNWYNIGPALFEDVEERWNEGRFGREYEEETNAYKLASWNTGADRGREKIFEVRTGYSDRLAVEEFFTDQFINKIQLYLYKMEQDSITGEIKYVIAETNPVIIRRVLKQNLTGRHTPEILVVNGNFQGSRQLLLEHQWTGYELDEKHRNGALRNIYNLWGRPVYLKTFSKDDEILVCCSDGKKIELKKNPS